MVEGYTMARQIKFTKKKRGLCLKMPLYWGEAMLDTFSLLAFNLNPTILFPMHLLK